MKPITYLRKKYDVNEITSDSDEGVALELTPTEFRWELYEKGESDEPIGILIGFTDLPNFYQYRNIYGKIQTGTAFTEEILIEAARLGSFL